MNVKGSPNLTRQKFVLNSDSLVNIPLEFFLLHMLNMFHQNRIVLSTQLYNLLFLP